MIEKIYPKKLEKGDTIALVAPSSPVKETEKIEKGAEYLESLGYKVKISKGCYLSYDYLAGSDEERAKYVNEAFADKSVDAIMCVRGGYGSPRILDRLDYDLIAKNPKIFCGFSDITAMHCAIWRKTGLVTFHTPMTATCMADGFDPDAAKSFFGLLTSEGPLGEYKNPDGSALKTICGGKASGIFIGGNVTLCGSVCGTGYGIDWTDKILFFEDVGENVYRIDRTLNTMRLCGAFEKCAGVVFGAFTGYEKKDDGMTIEQVIRDLIAPYGKPVLTGASSGHIAKNMSFPIGVRAEIDADAGKLTFTERHLS